MPIPQMPIFRYTSGNKDKILNTILKLTNSLPQKDFTVTIIEPDGDVVAQNRTIRQSEEFDSDIFLTCDHEIERCLGKDAFNLFVVNYKLTNSGFSDLESYNKHNINDPIPWKLFFIFDFPEGYSNDCISSLGKFLQYGHKLGVFPIFFMKRENPWGLFLNALQTYHNNYQNLFVKPSQKGTSVTNLPQYSFQNIVSNILLQCESIEDNSFVMK